METEKTLTVLVVEDEVPARELIVDYVLSRKDLRLGGIARDAVEALAKIQELELDLIFLDIHLPGKSGLELLEELESPPRIIFTTAYDSHAIRAFEIGAVDYLLKPFTMDRFNQAVERALSLEAREQAVNPVNLGLSFRSGENHYLIPYMDIVYLSSHGKQTVIHTTEEDYQASRLLGELESKLPGDMFQRIHKQHVVNLKYISHIQYFIGGRYNAYLKDEDETTLPVGKQYAEKLKKSMNL